MYRTFRRFAPYVILVAILAGLSFGIRYLFGNDIHGDADSELKLLIVGGALFISYLVNRIAPKTVIPSFVWAIFAGMALQPLLMAYTGNTDGLKITVEMFAAIVLFAGGLEIPFRSFQKWFFPIASLSLVGVGISAVGFSFALYYIVSLFQGVESTLLPSVVILGAALASTDPTAIIPTLKTLHFKRSFLREVAVSESALTDISGSIITKFLLLAFVSVPLTQDRSVINFFTPLFQKATYDALALQIISGIIVGYLGYLLIKKFYVDSETNEVDPALLIAVPVVTFVLGDFLGGAGFLAAFVSGLLSDVSGNLRRVTHFYESFLDHLIKPFIFIILGAIVPIAAVIGFAPLGILSAFVFMFVIRPLVVFISLLPWYPHHVFRIADVVFLSFIRETGIIAAVLIIIASSSGAIDSEFVIAIGMWVILLTLILEPPLTAPLARYIGVADLKE